ncbi:MAG: phage head closure protein [Hyphomicrobiaceae bacterium]|nr:phage head closure protein [Hyphomicrobiaceae bacterium]
MRRVPIGVLRHRLTLESPVRTDDGGGGAHVVWVPTAEVWGALSARTGSEPIVAEQTAGRVTHEIAIRHRAGVAPSMRFRRASRTFEIVAVLDMEEQRGRLRCLCREEFL